MAKAKDGSECFTRKNKSGGKYVTCKGTQMSANGKVTLAQQKASQKRKKDNQARKAAAAKPKAKPKAKPVGMIRGPPLPQRTSMSGGTGVITGPNGGRDLFAPSGASVMMSQFASRPPIPVYDEDRERRVYATQQEQDMADISAYMNETGQIPQGPFDPKFMKFQVSRGGLAKMKARSDAIRSKALRVTLPDGTILEQTKDGARVVSD